MVLSVVKQNILTIFLENLYLEGHLNRCIGSNVTVILLIWWILPAGGVASGRVCPAACAGGLFVYYIPTNTSGCTHMCSFKNSSSSKTNQPELLLIGENWCLVQKFMKMKDLVCHIGYSK